MMLIWTRGGGFTTRGGWAHAPPIFIPDLTRISLPCILETTSRIFFRIQMFVHAFRSVHFCWQKKQPNVRRWSPKERKYDYI